MLAALGQFGDAVELEAGVARARRRAIKRTGVVRFRTFAGDAKLCGGNTAGSTGQQSSRAGEYCCDDGRSSSHFAVPTANKRRTDARSISLANNCGFGRGRARPKRTIGALFLQCVSGPSIGWQLIDLRRRGRVAEGNGLLNRHTP